MKHRAVCLQHLSFFFRNAALVTNIAAVKETKVTKKPRLLPLARNKN